MLNQTVVKERGHTSKQTKTQREMTSTISSHATSIKLEVKVVLYQIQLQHWLIMRTKISKDVANLVTMTIAKSQ